MSGPSYVLYTIQYNDDSRWTFYYFFKDNFSTKRQKRLPEQVTT